MQKILSISLLVLFALLFIAILFANHYKCINEQQREYIENLTANVNLLIDGRKKDYADKVEIAKRNEELEKEAEKDTACFTWNTDISHSLVVQKLRKD